MIVILENKLSSRGQLFFFDSRTLDTEPQALNLVAKCKSTKRDADEIARELLKQIIELLIDVDSDGLGLIESPQLLSELKYSSQWKEFCIATAELQKVIIAYF